MTEYRLPPVLVAYGALVCVFIALPIAIVVATSVTATLYVTFPPQGFTLRWYGEMLQRREFLDSLTTSLQIAGVSGLITTTLGTLAGLGIARYRFAGREALRTLFLSPLMLPALVFAIALLQFYAALRMTPSLATLAAGHVIVTMPYVVRLVLVSVGGANPNLELAAQTLGASPRRAFWLVTLPLIRPGVLAGATFAFIISFDEVSISLLNSGPAVVTLPIRIFNYVENSFDPLITAVGTTTIAIAAVALFIIERVFGLGNLFGLR